MEKDALVFGQLFDNHSKKNKSTENIEMDSNIRRYHNEKSITFDVHHVDVSAKYQGEELILIPDLNFKVSKKCNLVITGPSGCGKSSLIKILAGLQRIVPKDEKESFLVVPNDNEVVYLPQQMYIIEGTLEQALHYLSLITTDYLQAPVLYDRENPQIFTRNEMQEVLDAVGLGYLSYRQGWDNLTVWTRVLSNGEQQRLMIASALLSSAPCIVMDESTSACDLTIEKEIFKQLKKRKKQFLCVSHRTEVQKYHTHILDLGVDKPSKIRLKKKVYF